MRRAVLATTGVSALIVALLSLKPHQLSAPAAGPAAPPTTSSASGSSSGGKSATGVFTGDPVGTRYGTVQVAVTLAKGKITAVRVLRAPDQNGRDQQITAYAVPRLTQEALDAQSAHIDSVSGASYTSQGYTQSLQSALDQAHA
ncbi:FMN-binding protein [Streptomyces sp. NBC_01506]|uniref:FMN-binding protein n=1 Tax=Streptomyces sp. NBC_01506 TaxID=2903887 RepID=UPI003867B569